METKIERQGLTEGDTWGEETEEDYPLWRNIKGGRRRGMKMKKSDDAAYPLKLLTNQEVLPNLRHVLNSHLHLWLLGHTRSNVSFGGWLVSCTFLNDVGQRESLSLVSSLFTVQVWPSLINRGLCALLTNEIISQYRLKGDDFFSSTPAWQYMHRHLIWPLPCQSSRNHASIL